MKAIVVLAILIAVMTRLWYPDMDGSRGPGYRAVAINYAIYRNEVFRYVHGQKGLSGDILLSALDLPSTWRPIRQWRARAEGGLCYVWGDTSPEEASAVRDLFHGSFAVGRAEGGRIVPFPVDGTPIPVPGFVPEGALVSVTEM